MILNTQCPFCSKRSVIQVDEQKFKEWQDGKLIQNAFPNLTPDQREQIITGICPNCWEETFKN